MSTLTTHTYTVDGMTCNGCVGTVERTLGQVPGVRSVRADLAGRRVTVEADRPVRFDELSDALRGTKYTLSPAVPAASQAPPPAHTVKDFLPLIVIATLIIAYTTAMVLARGSWDTMHAMRHFEGAFFIVFGGFKMLNWKGFAEAYATYDLLAARSRAYAYAYPLVEIALGVCYLAEWKLLEVSGITLVLMIIGAIGVGRALARKQAVACACLGTVFKIPMTKVTLAEDLLMAAMAVVMIVMLTVRA